MQVGRDEFRGARHFLSRLKPSPPLSVAMDASLAEVAIKLEVQSYVPVLVGEEVCGVIDSGIFLHFLATSV